MGWFLDAGRYQLRACWLCLACGLSHWGTAQSARVQRNEGDYIILVQETDLGLPSRTNLSVLAGFTCSEGDAMPARRRARPGMMRTYLLYDMPNGSKSERVTQDLHTSQ